MSTDTIREKLYDYIRVAEDKKVKAIYTMLEEEIEEVQDYWNNEEFTKELNKRSSDLKNGKVKGVAWKESRDKILKSGKKK